jgi:hypothetical protein
MPVLVSGKPRVLVLVGGMCVVAAAALEGVCLPMGDDEYAYGSEPGLSALGALSPSRGECYTCARCCIRFAGRKWRSNFARITNMFINGNGPSTSAHCRQARHLATSSPALFSLRASGAHIYISSSPHLLCPVPPLCGRSRFSTGLS